MLISKNCSICTVFADSYFWDNELRLVLCKSCKINFDKYERKKNTNVEWINRFENMGGPKLLAYKRIARKIQHELKLPYMINPQEGKIFFMFRFLEEKDVLKLTKLFGKGSNGVFTLGNNFITYWIDRGEGGRTLLTTAATTTSKKEKKEKENDSSNKKKSIR